MQNAIEAILELITAKQAAGSDRVVVSIDGRSGVGKSTLAKRLCDEILAVLVDGDAFFAGGVEILDSDPATLADSCIDWRKQREVLLQLRAGLPARFFPFDWDAFDGRLALEPVMIWPQKTIIVEGVYSARPELTDLIDVRILLIAPEIVRMKRLKEREGTIGPWERQWHRAEDYYFNFRQAQSSFDMVINSEPSEAKVV